jgi:hypothetical protein
MSGPPKELTDARDLFQKFIDKGTRTGLSPKVLEDHIRYLCWPQGGGGPELHEATVKALVTNHLQMVDVIRTLNRSNSCLQRLVITLSIIAIALMILQMWISFGRA